MTNDFRIAFSMNRHFTPIKIPLTDCLSSATVRISHIEAGRGAARNLNSMGLYPGNTVTVVRKSRLGGPVVVNSSNTEVAIGRRLAKKIIVEVL
jgi:Fe2+ transport system protein FeoA